MNNFICSEFCKKQITMTILEFSNKTSELIKMHPNQADLLCIATTDAFDEEDNSPMLDKLMDWCLEICANNVIIDNVTI